MFPEELIKQIKNPKLLEMIKEEFEKNKSFSNLLISNYSEENGPYLEEYVLAKQKSYNPNYKGESCVCGHSYDRHFDPFEDNLDVGCKYCNCSEYVEK